MNEKMNVYVTIRPKVKSRELYERLTPYNANVTDIGDKVFVYLTTDLDGEVIGKILDICKEYGDCSVDAHSSKTDAP